MGAERTVPNAAHYALADAQKRGQVWRLITQNVDRLHHAAGSEDALELHGTTHAGRRRRGDARRRRRFQLASYATRSDIQRRRRTRVSRETRTENKRRTKAVDRGADRTATSSSIAIAASVISSCRAARVRRRAAQAARVFFGDAPSRRRDRAATAASDGADAVLVVGSSVSTFSAFRLVRDAARRDVPVAILTKGETRADALAALKVERLAGQTLPLVLGAPTSSVFETYGY